MKPSRGTCAAWLLVGLVAMLAPAAAAKSGPLVTSDAVASAAQSDGRIVIAGVGACKGGCEEGGVYVARLNKDGTWDRRFGDGDGVAWLSAVGGTPNVSGLALGPGGQVVVGTDSLGPSGPLGPGTLRLARFTPAGELDPSFGNGGVQTVGFDLFRAGLAEGFHGSPNALAVSADGSITVAGAARDPQGADRFAAARFLADGQLDPGFGTGGIATVKIDAAADDESADAVLLEADGSALLAGRSGPTSSPSPSGAQNTVGMAVARLLPNGTPDPAFGSGGGTVVGALATAEYVNVRASAVSRTAGGIVVTGWSAGGLKPCSGFLLARLSEQGQLDSGFGDNGLVRQNFGGCEAAADALAGEGNTITVTGSQADGIVTGNAPRGRIAIARFESGTGAPDAGFGQSGVLQLRAAGLESGTTTLTGDAQQRVVGAGYVRSEFCSAGLNRRPFPCSALLVVRILADGRLDSSFGDEGLVTLPAICESARSAPCVLDRQRFRRLVRTGLPKRVALRGRSLGAAVSCKRPIREICRFKLVARARSGVPISRRVSFKVKQGRSRRVELSVRPGARVPARITLAVTARTPHQSAAKVRRRARIQ